MRESTSYIRPYIYIYTFTYTHLSYVCTVYFLTSVLPICYGSLYFDMILTTNQCSIFCRTTFLRWKTPRFWTYVMIACVLYFFAIIATSLIGKADAFKDDADAQECWNRLRGIGLNAWTLSQHHSWVGEIWGSPLEFGRFFCVGGKFEDSY